MDGHDEAVQSDFAQGRRAFLKRMAAFAFAAPVISSFVLDSDAFAGDRDQHGKNPPNQYGQNQTQTLKPPPNQYGYNQTQTLKPPPNQYGYNQTYNPPPNQYGHNQTQTYNPPPKNQKPPPKNQKPPPNQHGQKQNEGQKSTPHW